MHRPGWDQNRCAGSKRHAPAIELQLAAAFQHDIDLRQSAVEVAGDQATAIVVCERTTGGSAVPDRREVESRLREQELEMLSERYLRNLRSEATIITR